MALTVRLSSKTERALDALARRRRVTRSDVVREAIEHYAAAQAPDAHPADDSARAAWADVIGVVDLRRGDDARTSGKRFTDVVRAKARSRRAR